MVSKKVQQGDGTNLTKRRRVESGNVVKNTLPS